MEKFVFCKSGHTTHTTYLNDPILLKRFGEISNITLCFAQSNLGHAIITFTTPDAVERAARNSSSS